jgi:hypothetical protein
MRARRRTVSSAWRVPTTCRPMGRPPADCPAGTEHAGSPKRFPPWMTPGSTRRAVGAVRVAARRRDLGQPPHGTADCDQGWEAHGFPDDVATAVPVEVDGYLLHRSLPNRRTTEFQSAVVNHYMSARSMLPWTRPGAWRRRATCAMWRWWPASTRSPRRAPPTSPRPSLAKRSPRTERVASCRDRPASSSVESNPAFSEGLLDLRRIEWLTDVTPFST